MENTISSTSESETEPDDCDVAGEMCRLFSSEFNNVDLQELHTLVDALNRMKDTYEKTPGVYQTVLQVLHDYNQSPKYSQWEKTSKYLKNLLQWKTPDITDVLVNALPTPEKCAAGDDLGQQPSNKRLHNEGSTESEISTKRARKDVKFYNFIKPEVNAYVESKGIPKKVLPSTVQYLGKEENNVPHITASVLETSSKVQYFKTIEQHKIAQPQIYPDSRLVVCSVPSGSNAPISKEKLYKLPHLVRAVPTSIRFIDSQKTGFSSAQTIKIISGPYDQVPANPRPGYPSIMKTRFVLKPTLPSTLQALPSTLQVVLKENSKATVSQCGDKVTELTVKESVSESCHKGIKNEATTSCVTILSSSSIQQNPSDSCTSVETVDTNKRAWSKTDNLGKLQSITLEGERKNKEGLDVLQKFSPQAKEKNHSLGPSIIKELQTYTLSVGKDYQDSCPANDSLQDKNDNGFKVDITENSQNNCTLKYKIADSTFVKQVYSKPLMRSSAYQHIQPGLLVCQNEGQKRGLESAVTSGTAPSELLCKESISDISDSSETDDNHDIYEDHPLEVLKRQGSDFRDISFEKPNYLARLLSSQKEPNYKDPWGLKPLQKRQDYIRTRRQVIIDSQRLDN